MMIRIAVVDDEPIIVKFVAEKTKAHADRLQIPISLTTYCSGREFLTAYYPGLFDAVFLDIDMPDLNGDVVSAELAKIDPSLLLVYVTSYCNDEVYTMLKYMPIGFLRKAFLEKELDDMLLVLKNKIAKAPKMYFLQSGKKKIQIPLINILYMESERNYVHFHTNSNEEQVKSRKNKEKPIKVRTKLDQVEEQVENYGFIRIHASFLVNYQYIYSIQRGKVKLDNGEELPISRSHEEEVNQKFLYFSRGS